MNAMADLQQKVLQKYRYIAQGTAASLPLTVNATSQLGITIPFAGVLSNVTYLTHTRIRVSVLSSVLTTDSGGQTFINIESANLQTNSQQVVQPCFTGSALGAFNNAALQGTMEWDTDDLQGLGITAPTGCNIGITVNNSDSSNHNVTGATATILVEATQYPGVEREGLVNG